MTVNKAPNGRLPRTVVPEFYAIRISPDIDAAAFKGDQRVDLSVLSPVSEIVLNSIEIVITHATVSQSDGTTLTGVVSYDETWQQATIKFDGQIGPGKWQLHMRFEGTLNDNLRGFYRSKYRDENGIDRFMATTKFEPSDARRAFPCWDEPNFKAVFQISLEIDRDQAGVSNMELLSEEILPNGKKLLTFAPSIKMSSYLVAYVIGNLVASAPVFSGNTEIRVWSVPDKSHMTSFALQAARFSLDYFRDYFGIAYPSKKLDLLAIPDFASGAMENYGCITYRETALLVIEQRATFAELQRVAEVIMHENAHMWFGDLVTMNWWNGLWLNEAFATFMAAKAVDLFRPEWKFWDSFSIEKAAALRIDGLQNTRPIEFPVITPEDARAMFDVLTYEKGCAILRMLELYIGEETFREGCRIYMRRHQYANTETSDLWNALAEACAKASVPIPVAEMMDGWVFQSGYPVIEADLDESGSAIKLSQKRFQYIEQGDSHQILWHVPVTVRSKLSEPGPEQLQTLTLDQACSTFYLGEQIASVVINAGSTGFARVSYSKDLKGRIFANFTDLAVSERFNILNDSWALVLSGKLPLASYVDDLKQIGRVALEDDPNVWSVITASLHYMRRLMGPCALVNEAGYADFTAGIIRPTLDKLEALPESAWTGKTGQLLGQLFGTLGSFGEEKARSRACELFAKYKKDPLSVPASLLPAVIDTVAACGDDSVYREFIELKAKAATPQEESRLIHALAGFRKSELIAKTLDDCLNGSIRTQDAPMVIRSVFSNMNGCWQAWDFVKVNWAKINSLYPMQGVVRLVDGITTLVSSEKESEIALFFKTHKVKAGEKAVAQNLETLSIANRMRKREEKTIEQLSSGCR